MAVSDLASTEVWILTNFPSPSGRGERVRALWERE